jgi:uncharacterized protein (TIGR03437 family)
MRLALFLLTATLSIAGEFTTSLGDANPYTISAITTDSAGNTYVVGSRALASFASVIAVIGDLPPVGNPYFTSGSSDIFVTKLDPNGRVLFTDTFAGKGVDTGKAIAVDPTGNIYIAGTTTSSDFPLSKAIQTQPNPAGTGFIIKLTNDGSTILYSTYFGGVLGQTSITSLATDSKGNLYFTGTTNAIDFPHTNGMPSGVNPLGAGNIGVIMASLSAAGDKILYSGTLVGGLIPIPASAVSTNSVGIAVDAAGNAYVAGNTGNSNLPTTSGVLLPSGSFTGFLAKVNAAGTGLSYLTYLPNLVSSIAVDPAGDAYLAGFNFAAKPGSSPNSYIEKLNPTASALIWTNNLNNQASSVSAIAIDPSGNVWATGATSSSTFPNVNGWTTGPEFLIGLDATGAKLTYSALYPAGTIAQAISVDPSGLVHVAGSNGLVSAIAPTTAPAMKIFTLQNAAGGNATARISPAELISIYGPGIGPATVASAPLTNGFYPKTVAGVQVTINGMNIPLLYVSANQINAVVPMGIAPNAAATLRVINGTSISPDYPVWIVPSTGQAFPNVLNQDYSFNSQAHPAKAGSIVIFYATGWQSNFAPLADGQVATTAQNVCNGNCVGTTNFTVVYAGAAPAIIAGVTQFNVRVNAGTSSGPSPVVLNLIGPAPLIQTVWVTP